MSAVHKQIAHILPEGNEFGNQPLFYVSKKWIVLRNGMSKLHILKDFSYIILLCIENRVVSIACTENENRLQILYYCVNGEWNIVDITDAHTVYCYSRNGGNQLPIVSSFRDVNQFIIKQQLDTGDYPLYHLVQGNSPKEFYGVDFFNRIHSCCIEYLDSNWYVHSSVQYTNDTWKVTALSFSSSLLVGCDNGSIYRLSQSIQEEIAQLPQGHATQILPSYVINEYNQVFHVTDSCHPLSFQTNRLICFNDIVLALVDGELYSLTYSFEYRVSISGEDTHALGISNTCADFAVIQPSELILLHINGQITKCPFSSTPSSRFMDYHAVINKLEMASLSYSTFKERNQECMDYFCWKNQTEEEIRQCKIEKSSWRVNDDSIQCVITCSLPSSVTLLILSLTDSVGESQTVQHPILFHSTMHTFEFKPLHQPLFASILSVSLSFVAFPQARDQLPVVRTLSLESFGLIHLGIPFLSHLQESKQSIALPTVVQMHSPPSLSHEMLQKILPPSSTKFISYQLIPRGNSIVIMLKGTDEETLRLARTYIHHKMVEKTKENQDLWVVDLLRLQTQLDGLLEELKCLEVDSSCVTVHQLKDRIRIIEKVISINETLANMLL